MTAQELFKKRWVRVTGYSCLGAFSFLYFLFVGFPFDDLVPARLAAIERTTGMHVETADVHAGWLFDLVADGVKVTPIARRGFGAPAAGAEAEDPVLVADKVAVSINPFALLLMRASLGIDAHLYGGRVYGSVSASKSTTSVALTLSGLEIGKYPMLAQRFQVNAGGQVSGTVALTMPNDDASKANGEIDLTIKDAKILASNVYNAFQIPQTTFDKGAAVKVSIKDGKATFQDVGLHGADLDVALDGDLELRKQMEMSQWDARADIRASDTFKAAIPMLDVFLSPGKGTDGIYHYRLQGMLQSPRPIPDSRGGTGR